MPACRLPRHRLATHRGALPGALLLALVLFPTAPVRASAPPPADPAAELFRFVPDDVGFCLAVRDLRRHYAELVGSPFAEAFRQTSLGKTLAAAAEWKQLHKLDALLEKQVGLGWARLRDDVLGDAVVFAYRPGPPGQPEREQGLFLVRARNPAALAALVRHLEQAQKASGELKEVVARTHQGVKYYKRVEGKATHFYLLRGPVLAFSGQEEMLRQAIERERSAPAVPPVATRLGELGLGRSLVALWLNPRAFDAVVTAGMTRAGQAGARTFAGCWKALRSVGVGLSHGEDLRLSVVVRASPEHLPPSARRLLATAARPSDLWPVIPEDALLAVGGRLDPSALFELLGEFMTPAGRRALQNDLERTLGAVLGKNVVREVLPALGPDWGLWLTAPGPGDKNWTPQAVFAGRVARGDPTAPVDEALYGALLFGARLVVLGHNKLHPDRPVRLNTLVTDKQEIKYLTGERTFPPGWRPAVALRGGYLVLASSPEAVRRFRPAAGPAPAGPAPLLRVSFKGWRDYLKGRREPLGAALAERDKVSPGQARQRLDGLRAGLELFDRLELLQEASPGQVTFTLRLRTARPLAP
jgi:hypothetical protein